VKVMNRVTLKHLFKNKKRTLVTLIGTIVSVAMIMAVATLGFSFMDFMQQAAIADGGSWHVRYRNLTAEQVAAVGNDSETVDMTLQHYLGYTKLEGGQNKNKPYLLLQATDKKGFSLLPFHLTSGRMPENGNEVVISEHIATNGGVEYKIGDVLRLEVGQRYRNEDLVGGKPLTGAKPLYNDVSYGATDGNETILTDGTVQEFTVVGIMGRPGTENYSGPGYTVLTYENQKDISARGDVDAYVTVKHLTSDIYDYANDLAERNGIEHIALNNDLLRYSGVFENDTMRSTLYSFMVIIILIIMVGSVALIYNAFAISVSERARNLGMLSSIGATKRQKRNSVFFEGFLIGLISIPLGILFGYLGIRVTMAFIAPLLESTFYVPAVPIEFRAVITPVTVIVSTVLSAVTILISVYIPAKRASRVTPIDAIRQTQDVKLRSKDVKTSKVTRKLFGFEAEIGLKNLKRNRKRYRVTVFSLMISVVLFLGVSTFTTYLNKSFETTDMGINFDVAVSASGMDSETTNQLFDGIRQLDGVKESTSINKMYLNTYFPENQLTSTAAQGLSDYWSGRQEAEGEQTESIYCEINLIAIDDASFAEYAKQIGADESQLDGSAGLRAIAVNQAGFYDAEHQKFSIVKLLKNPEGEQVVLQSVEYDEEKEESVPFDLAAVTVVKETDVTPQGVMVNYQSNSLNLIVSNAVLEEVAAMSNPNMVSHFLYLNSGDSEALTKKINTFYNTNYSQTSGSFNVIDAYQARNESQKLVTLLMVLTGGFIALITLICIANIFNTISTSIGLRKREFAMLKSVGMTPGGFNKMLRFESLFYGIKALLWGLPVSFLLMALMYWTLSNNFGFGFLIPWQSVVIAILAVFIVVGLTMMYSSSKVKKENIIDALKDENL
jgi:putative ABC transport system permease protein